MLKIETILVTPFAQNCRVLFQEGGSDAVVIDPGGDVFKIASALKNLKVSAKEIWLTHSHLDHCGGVSELKDLTGAKLIGHREGQLFRERVPDIAAMYGIPQGEFLACPEPDIYIDEGAELSIGSHKFQVCFTPGHAPDHLIFHCQKEGILIAGDTLFQGSIGRSDLPGGDHDTLIRSIKEKILTLPVETVVMPGHGPDTTVGEERDSNPFL